jgi:hypothetical protein
MKPLRVLLLPAALLALLAALARWPWAAPVPARFAAPEDCVVAHAEACKAGDGAACLDCLAGVALEEARRLDAAGELPAALRRSLLGIKSWVLAAPAAVAGDAATLDVDLARQDGTRRTRFHLRQTAAGWRIVAIDPPRDVPVPIPHGTHVKDR